MAVQVSSQRRYLHVWNSAQSLDFRKPFRHLFAGRSITHLCGARTETCPPGMKLGDPISPPGGYVGGDMQMLTDIAIDPAGDVWVANNWQDADRCFGKPPEATSTHCGGNGLTVLYGMAKPVRVPLIGPPRAP